MARFRGLAGNRAVIGAGAAVLASACFTLNDTLAKLFSSHYPLLQMVLLWTVSTLVFLMLIVVPATGGLAGIRMQRPWVHLVRSLLVVVANFCFFVALATMPLAEAVSIFFFAPVLITAFAALFLGEKVWPGQWLAVALGLVGVVLISRPGTEAFRTLSLLPLVSAVAYAAMQTLTRAVAATESATALTLPIQLAFLVVCGFGGLWFGDGHLAGSLDPSADFLLRAWVWPRMADLAAFLAVGLSSAIGGTLISQAYRLAPGALVAPFEYAALPLALAVGLVVFGEWPDGLALAGIGLILAAGVAAIWRDARGAAAPQVAP